MRTVWLIYARAGSLILLMSNQNSRIFIQRIISKSIIYVWTGHNRSIKPIDERPCSRTSYNIHPKNWAKFKNTISSCEIILSFFIFIVFSIFPEAFQLNRTHCIPSFLSNTLEWLILHTPNFKRNISHTKTK